MKKTLVLLSIILFSCNKEEFEPVVTPKPVTKNYNLPSYDLQQSDITINIHNLRSKYGNNSTWEIFAVAFLDINGDGNDDIFTSSTYGKNEKTPSQLYIYKNGDYVPDNSYFNVVPSFYHPRKAITGDFNNDKRPDIFVAAHGYDQDPWPGEHTQLILSNSSGKYDITEFKEKVGFYHAAASGDIDNDGDLDIFVLNKMLSYFLINDGKGNFTYSTTHIDINDIDNQYTCELIDINKDGYIDIIMGGHEFENKGTTRVYWGNSTYTYNQKSIIPNIAGYGVITDIESYDLDNDGTNELILNRAGGDINYTNFYDGWYIQVLKMDNKEFIDMTNQFIDNNSVNHIGRHNWITWIRFQDYDKNGKVDLFSMVNGPQSFIRWELRDKKLIRIN
jgi:hypothetical protein